MKRSIQLCVTVFLLLLPALSWSASIRPGAYVSGFIGATIPREADVESSQLVNGSIQPFSDRVDFDPGLYLGGTGGYDFGFLRLEGELSYKYSEIDSITASDGFRFGNPDGNVGVFAMMANAFVDLHNKGPVTPYVGGGIGFANLHLSDTFGTDLTDAGSPERVFLYPEDDDTVFAYQAGAGIGIALNRRLTLDIGYRYFGTSKGRFGDGFDTAELRFESHNAAVGLRVKF